MPKLVLSKLDVIREENIVLEVEEFVDIVGPKFSFELPPRKLKSGAIKGQQEIDNEPPPIASEDDIEIPQEGMLP